MHGGGGDGGWLVGHCQECEESDDLGKDVVAVFVRALRRGEGETDHREVYMVGFDKVLMVMNA